ncbi:DUF1465 family protein [Pedomonas sp. V897]|uniref:DUF1465 family protein n=1 Tax=Pedomonas sp. V897 TaxID=3446482 RepID=UPI003EDF15CB
MTDATEKRVLTPALIDPLYAEAIAVADEARTYFSAEGLEERQTLDPMERVLFSCESLKVTTRLMHVISWLLVGKAVAAGEMTPEEAATPDRRLGFVEASDEAREPRLGLLPEQALSLIRRSQTLYDRVRHIEAGLFGDGAAAPAGGGARGLQNRLSELF